MLVPNVSERVWSLAKDVDMKKKKGHDKGNRTLFHMKEIDGL